MFLDLVDRSGRIQLIVEQERRESTSTSATSSASTGRPARSRRGEPSLVTSELELLAKIRAPLPDTFHGVTDRETRYRQRYLDLLMNEESRRACELRARIVAAVRALPRRRGLPRGRDADPAAALRRRLRRAVRHALERARRRPLPADRGRALPQAADRRRARAGLRARRKDFRNESISYKHAPEFTQVEWYEAYADYRDTMERVEALVETAALDDGRHDEGDVPRPRRSTSHAPWRARQASSRRSRRTASGRATRPSCARQLEERGVDTTQRPHAGRSSSTTRTRTSSSRADPADDRPRLADRAVAVRADDRRRPDASSSASSASSAGWSSRTPSAS